MCYPTFSNLVSLKSNLYVAIHITGNYLGFNLRTRVVIADPLHGEFVFFLLWSPLLLCILGVVYRYF